MFGVKYKIGKEGSTKKLCCYREKSGNPLNMRLSVKFVHFIKRYKFNPGNPVSFVLVPALLKDYSLRLLISFSFNSFFKVPPMLWIPHQLVGVPLHTNISLECFTEAHPTSLNYWTRDDGHMIHDSKKYR